MAQAARIHTCVLADRHEARTIGALTGSECNSRKDEDDNGPCRKLLGHGGHL
ncbi:hypothetical protein roselon_01633 [Roseibacterium elongatum DSM 19469]|uniref:Uncharacterized protein n=1 Tax=Roseicyclus elongatus DSM 19469 TaxID=1294273 RepID=W8S1H7_9RHOB|nr:hypothetical protein roselon_01633 [Roseibacterium elongatum DSM 19469]